MDELPKDEQQQPTSLVVTGRKAGRPLVILLLTLLAILLPGLRIGRGRRWPYSPTTKFHHPDQDH